WTAVAPRRSWPAGPGFLPALALMTLYAVVHQVLFPTHYVAEMSPRVLIVLDYLRSVHVLNYRVASLIVVALVIGGVLLMRSERATRAVVSEVAIRVAAATAFGVFAAAIVASAWPDFATNLAWLRLYVGWPIIGVA